MQKKEVATAARMFNRILDEINNSMRFEFCAAAKAEVTYIQRKVHLKNLYMFYTTA